MNSNFEKAFNLVQSQKENNARIRMVKEMEEINQLKRENRYFDNSISSELYSKVTEAVDNLTDRLDESELDNNETNLDRRNNENNHKGMQLKKKMVDNLMQMREDSIKMSIIYYFLY